MHQLQLIVFLILSSCVAAQSDTTVKVITDMSCKCGFEFNNTIGLLEGEVGSSFHYQTVNGFNYNTWFAGIGAGLDYYRFRTIPLFLDLRKYLFQKPGSPFIYGDVGMHFPWVRERDKYWYGNSKFHNGLYYDVGLGYKKNISKAGALLISAGYSFKEMKETRTTYQCGFVPGCWESIEKFEYRFKRLSMKVGWQF